MNAVPAQNKKSSNFSKVIKRDGTIVPYKKAKITAAIYHAGKASKEFGHEEAKKLADKVQNLVKKRKATNFPTVEEIQDIVEKVLIKAGWPKTAKAYILYRELHSKIRNINSVVVAEELLEGYLDNSDWRVKENSNMSYSLQGLNNHIAGSISARYWLNSIYPENVRNAHLSGDLHLHDLQLLGPYCVGWDLQDLLIRGFTGVAGKIASSPAKHFSSALGQIVNFFYTLQGESAGAQAMSNFDTLLAPFIRYDNLSYNEVKQHLQEFMFNMNVPTRVGFQTPFTNITLDLVPPKALGSEPVIVGGKYMQDTYSMFQKEMDIFNSALAEVMLEGDADGRVFSFPIPTYNITPDFDWANPTLDPIWKMTAKYGIPYFSNFVNSDMSPDDARSMCCRLRLDNRELRKRGGGFFGASPLTGSIGVVTVNLPRIGYLATSKKDFFDRLQNVMNIARQSLETKREILENFTNQGLYPYSKFYLASVKTRFDQYWKNHFNTIGLVGLNEALINFNGTSLLDSEGHKLGQEILEHMNGIILSFQEKSDMMYNLEATPAEATSYRLAKKDKEMYPEIKVANELDYQNKGTAPYYTNSSQLPVGFTDDIFEALDMQDDLQTKYTGGTVFHTFLGEKLSDIEITKNLVKKISHNYRLPYYTLTPTFSVCPNDGYQSGEHITCPKCGSECEVYSRIVGYLRPVKQWNVSKQAEYQDRKEYINVD